VLKDRIKESRINAHLSQDELAKCLKIGKRTLVDYENGTSEPKASVLLSIAENCNINESWLLTGKGSMYLEEKKSNSVVTHGDINSSNGGIVINGVQDCDINHQAPSRQTNKSQITMNTEEELTELCSLIKDYATPKYRMEIKEKLLRFKELH